MKDQLGVCRWNYGLRLIQQHAKTNLRSYAQANKLQAKKMSSRSRAWPSPAMASNTQEKLKQSEESLRTVMYLSCWGPN
ncbi:hypothetical protein PHJA_000000300 [Phtheirospermum japonicum]|uniref:Uncharacterized protein n=1 Tax=Phtheirospermum japonicum TaxID=374723 RepID=A0A830B0Y9_9LAMI|nr:hypothetical protein PHJA_000000300 [Phtheirospermum japonicum]